MERNRWRASPMRRERCWGKKLGCLLRLSRAIDTLNQLVGRAVVWLVLIITLVSAGNALVRKLFDTSSNALLEIQWYLFSAIFLLCAGYTLQKNAHVRIDVFSGRLSRRAQAWIDVFGALFLLMPIVTLVIWLSWGVFVESFRTQEVSASAGGLIIWPARLLVPIGFALLLLQGLSESIKRVGFLTGRAPDPLGGDDGPPGEEGLAADIVCGRREGHSE